MNAYDEAILILCHALLDKGRGEWGLEDRVYVSSSMWSCALWWWWWWWLFVWSPWLMAGRRSVPVPVPPTAEEVQQTGARVRVDILKCDAGVSSRARQPPVKHGRKETWCWRGVATRSGQVPLVMFGCSSKARKKGWGRQAAQQAGGQQAGSRRWPSFTCLGGAGLGPNGPGGE